jgi:hypothetical protein
MFILGVAIVGTTSPRKRGETLFGRPLGVDFVDRADDSKCDLKARCEITNDPDRGERSQEP